jgi:hypothetical protein
MNRWTTIVSTVAVLLASGCSRDLGGVPADAATDATDASNATDAADGPACVGNAGFYCVLTQCPETGATAPTCVDGVWKCLSPYQRVEFEPCCTFGDVCAHSDGTTVPLLCMAGITYCPGGSTRVHPGVDAAVDTLNR